MRLEAAIKGDLHKIVKAEAARIRRAENAAVKKAGEKAKAETRKHMREKGLSELGFRWKVKFYPARGDKGALAVLFVRGGATAHRSKDIVFAFEHGTTIRPKNGGKYLWIPTQFNRPLGRRNRGHNAQTALTLPSQVKGGFFKRMKNGNLLFFAPVEEREIMSKKGGRMLKKAYLNNRLLGSGRRKRTDKILSHGAVPLFTLLPQVTVSKKTDVLGMAEQFHDDLVRALMQELAKDG